jgi:hypothetical protein
MFKREAKAGTVLRTVRRMAGLRFLEAPIRSGWVPLCQPDLSEKGPCLGFALAYFLLPSALSVC